MSKDAVLRKMGRAVSGRLQLPATTRLVRYAAAREYEDGNLAEAKRLYENSLRAATTRPAGCGWESSLSVRNGSRRP